MGCALREATQFPGTLQNSGGVRRRQNEGRRPWALQVKVSLSGHKKLLLFLDAKCPGKIKSQHSYGLESVQHSLPSQGTRGGAKGSLSGPCATLWLWSSCASWYSLYGDKILKEGLLNYYSLYIEKYILNDLFWPKILTLRQNIFCQK